MSDEKEFIDADKMYRKLLEVGGTWADSKAAYEALEQTSKSILADLTEFFRFPQGQPGVLVPERSRIEREQEALRSKQYRDHLAAVAVAHKTYLRAQVRYESLKTLVELRRSMESTRRAEMRL
jgi:hypothetical protein